MNDQAKQEYIAQAIEVFNKCVAEHGDWLKDYMYMYTDSEGIHHFKNIISRRYVAVQC